MCTPPILFLLSNPICVDCADYTAFFLSSGERDKFERENLENGSSLTVVSTYECTIDQLPDDVHDDFINELFSEWV